MTPPRNYTYLSVPDKDYTVDFAATSGRKEVSVHIELTNDNKLEIVVRTNRVDDYEIEYSELSVDVSDDSDKSDDNED